MLVAAALGSDLDAEKSVLLKKLGALPAFKSIAIIDDNEQDARHIIALLHLLLGRDVTITHYRNVPVAIQKMRDEMPDLLFLDDYLPPLDRAESSLRSLYRFGFKAPFVLISSTITRSRRAELLSLSPLSLIEKDDINSFSIARALAALIPETS